MTVSACVFYRIDKKRSSSRFLVCQTRAIAYKRPRKYFQNIINVFYVYCYYYHYYSFLSYTHSYLRVGTYTCVHCGTYVNDSLAHFRGCWICETTNEPNFRCRCKSLVELYERMETNFDRYSLRFLFHVRSSLVCIFSLFVTNNDCKYL